MTKRRRINYFIDNGVATLWGATFPLKELLSATQFKFDGSTKTWSGNTEAWNALQGLIDSDRYDLAQADPPAAPTPIQTPDLLTELQKHTLLLEMIAKKLDDLLMSGK